MTKPLVKSADNAKTAYSKGALKLILTAERLFSEHGIEGVSLRQIVSEAGLVNSYLIHHHFGDREGLVQAVYDLRLQDLDKGCRLRLEAVRRSGGEIGPQELIAARFMPLVESLDAHAQKTYPLFLLRLLYQGSVDHPHLRSKVPQPACNEVNRRLAECFPGLPAEVFNTRFRLASDLFLSAMVEKRRLAATGRDPYASESPYWHEIINILAAIFRQPFTA